MDFFKLAYRNIAVIGAGGGMGALTATRLGAAGGRMVLVEPEGTPGESSARAALAEIRGAGGSGIFLGCDILDTGSCKRMIAAAADQGYPIDALVFLAGRVETRGTEELEPEDFLEQCNLHGASLVRLVKPLLPTWTAAGHGAAIVMTSIAAILPAIGKEAYDGSKAHATNITQAWGARYGPLGLRFVPVLANRVGTASARDRAAASPAHEAEMLSTLVSGRWIEPKEVAGSIHFLLTEDARPINGDLFLIADGATSALAPRPAPPA